MKSANSRYILPLFATAMLIFFGGCQQQQQKKNTGVAAARLNEPLLLTVDFEPNVPLKYNFVSERQIHLVLDPSKEKGGGEEDTTEKLEMEIVYKPIKVDPYGYSTIEATCNSVKVFRSQAARRNKGDAVESAIGKSFTLKITPTGKIADYSSLERLIKELGDKAFTGSGGGRGRIKDPDMIMDFVATQWYLWNSISSVKQPLKGVKKGQKWGSELLAPMPFVSNIGRDVEYTFDGTTDVNGVEYARISSSYKLSQLVPNETFPYSGSFQMRGTFGFLRDYRTRSIEGTGEELYDIKRGVIKSDIQKYKAIVNASIFGLGSGPIEPYIEINQTITMTLAE